ncbi:rCG58967 [Rattus norvegicus]|uniref:RCG58967 n=1 Tax=Rattus norvegicus TaxID=10116 RepID=A6KQ77_RAT|nr:rCG58967 [Rattus norvegicus]
MYTYLVCVGRWPHITWHTCRGQRASL